MAAEFLTFENLDAWKACRELRNYVAKSVVIELPKDEQLRLKDQLLRSARSTTANIAEGHGRYHYRDSIKYLRQARGSAYEVLDHMITGMDEGFFPDSLVQRVRSLIDTSVKLINGYSRYLEKKVSV